MFKKALLVMVTLALIVLFQGCGNNTTNNDTTTPDNNQEDYVPDTGPYQNEELGIKLGNPYEWEKIEDRYGTLVALISPQIDENDDFRENVNIVTEDIPAEVTLEEYAASAQEQLGEVLMKFELLEDGKTELIGKEAYSHKYAFNQGEYDLTGIQIFFIQNQTAFIVTYTAKTDSYDEYYEKAQAIFNTLEIK